MERPMHHISLRQLIWLTAVSIIARGLFTVPRDSALEAGTGAWAVLLTNGILALGVIAAIAALSAAFPGRTVAEYAEELLSKWPGKIMSTVVLSTFIIHILLTARVFSEVVGLIMLRDTPIEISLALMMAVAAYGAGLRFEHIARTAETLFPIMLAFFLVLLVSTLPNVERVNLQPFFRIDGSFGQALALNTPVWFGMQALFVCVAYLRDTKGAIAHALKGGLIVVAVYLLMTVSTIGVLGHELTRQLVFPSITTFRASAMVGSVLERPGLLFNLIWISVVTLNITIHLSAAARTVVGIVGLRPSAYRWVVWPIGVGVGVTSIFLFPGRTSVFAALVEWSPVGIAFVAGAPIVMLIVAALRGYLRPH